MRQVSFARHNTRGERLLSVKHPRMILKNQHLKAHGNHFLNDSGSTSLIQSHNSPSQAQSLLDVAKFEGHSSSQTDSDDLKKQKIKNLNIDQLFKDALLKKQSDLEKERKVRDHFIRFLQLPSHQRNDKDISYYLDHKIYNIKYLQ